MRTTTLALAFLLVACSKGGDVGDSPAPPPPPPPPPDPALITHADLQAGALLLIQTGVPASSGDTSLVTVKPDGSVAPVVFDGVALAYDGAAGRAFLTPVIPAILHDASSRFLAISFEPSAADATLPEKELHLGLAFDRQTGVAYPIPGAGLRWGAHIHGEPPHVQEGEPGVLYVEGTTVYPHGLTRVDLRGASPVRSAVAFDSDQGAFVVDAEGNVASSVDAGEPVYEFHGTGGQSLHWSGGLLTGQLFRCLDGHLYLTRGEAGTTELLRVDFSGPEVALVQTASWPDDRAGLWTTPLRLGDALYFPQADGIAVIRSCGAAPVLLPGDLGGSAGATAGALWFAERQRLDGPITRVVRWTPDRGPQDLLTPGLYDIWTLVPVDDASAVFEGARLEDGARVTARVDLSGTVEQLPLPRSIVDHVTIR